MKEEIELRECRVCHKIMINQPWVLVINDEGKPEYVCQECAEKDEKYKLY